MRHSASRSYLTFVFWALNRFLVQSKSGNVRQQRHSPGITCCWKYTYSSQWNRQRINTWVFLRLARVTYICTFNNGIPRNRCSWISFPRFTTTKGCIAESFGSCRRAEVSSSHLPPFFVLKNLKNVSFSWISWSTSRVKILNHGIIRAYVGIDFFSIVVCNMYRYQSFFPCCCFVFSMDCSCLCFSDLKAILFAFFSIRRT